MVSPEIDNGNTRRIHASVPDQPSTSFANVLPGTQNGIKLGDDEVRGSRLVCISDFTHVAGHCFVSPLPHGLPAGDSVGDPFASGAVLFEDGQGLGPAHTEHAAIGARGGGGYSHWQGALYFSSSDHSDPRSNGRQYQLYIPLPDQIKWRKKQAINTIIAIPDELSTDDSYAAVEKCLEILYPAAKMGEDQKLFWADQAFIHAYERIAGQNYRSLERKFAAFNLARSVLWVGGDLAECGAYTGATAYFLALARDQAGMRSQQLFLFDSFEGLSEPGPRDGSFWHSGSLAAGEEICRRNLGMFEGVHVMRGWIPTRFGEVGDRQFCFVHLDVDLYQPSKDSLEFFYPRLRSGGILLCDDYGFTTCPGAKQAMDEFFADKLERIVHLPTGQAFAIRR